VHVKLLPVKIKVHFLIDHKIVSSQNSMMTLKKNIRFPLNVFPSAKCQLDGNVKMLSYIYRIACHFQYFFFKCHTSTHTDARMQLPQINCGNLSSIENPHK